MTFDPKDMDRSFRRIAVCDCSTGHFITTMSKPEVEYLYDIIIKANITNGDFITNDIAQSVVNNITDLKEYINDGDGGGDNKND